MTHYNMQRLVLAAAAGVAVAALAACGDIEVKAEPQLPPSLITKLPMTVGVFYGNNFKTYVHREDRWGAAYVVDLGTSHMHLADDLFRREFDNIVPVESLDSIPQDANLRAVIEPRIERFSFLTARDTGGDYFAVTIDYRLNLFNTKGERLDSFTFVGYGSAPSSSLGGSETPMQLATRAAMRDAAAKFLVQFPEQSTVKKLVAGEAIQPLSAVAVADNSSAPPVTTEAIEIVPIVEKTPDRPNEKIADPLTGAGLR